MISLPDRSRVLVPGFSDWGAAGSGICLTHTTTFMADHLCGTRPFPAIRHGDRPVSGARFEGPPPNRSADPAAHYGQRLPEPVGDHGVGSAGHQGPQVVGG